jgi:hypothetical protein
VRFPQGGGGGLLNRRRGDGVWLQAFAARIPRPLCHRYGAGLGRRACTGGRARTDRRATAGAAGRRTWGLHVAGRRVPRVVMLGPEVAGPPRYASTVAYRGTVAQRARARPALWPARHRGTASHYFNRPYLKAKYSKICN